MSTEKKSLVRLGPQRTFSGRSLSTISFPLGGIGTGSVGLGGDGGLRDWQIFNRPNHGWYAPKTFPVVWAREEGKQAVCRVLQAPPQPPYIHGGGGDPFAAGEGLPHMDDATFRGEYPFAWVEFHSRALPLRVSLEAYNPFIPSDPEGSGYPAAILRYTLENPRRRPVDVTVAWSVLNMVGAIGAAERDPVFGNVEFGYGQNVNFYKEGRGLRGLLFTSEKWPADHPRFGSMALLTPERKVTVLKYWKRAPWFTPMHDFWDTFFADGRFQDRDYPPSDDKTTDAGALGIVARLKPGETRTVTFYLTWYFPNFEKYWGDAPCCASPGCGDSPKPRRAVWKNHYASRFKDAFDVAADLHAAEKRLHEATRRFHATLFGSTFPPEVLDAVSSQMAILKTPTVLRLEDGTFYGWEGCAAIAGCCEGSCTHVWNYQQALPFLFPSLERSMRDADYRYNLRPDGSMCFRLQLPLGTPPNDFHACGDGQMGGVIKTYRDWKISGDDAWLRHLWPSVKASLEYAWTHWDPEKKGVMEDIQHNTYDIEFLGPNPLMGAFYLAALTAGAAMARHLGETEKAEEYLEVCRRGRAYLDTTLFNGQYYEQQYEPAKAPEYQFGRGCLSDQMLGQWMAQVAGLGDILDKRHVRAALKSIYRYNWKRSLSEHANAQRVYALNDEAGLLLCTWPRGGRPAVPFPYSDEVWTGIEYQVACHLILEGFVEEGLTIVKGARDRHDGLRRNPWDEFECGHHYARAMSSYGLVTALSGFVFDKGAGVIGFHPRVHREDFSAFWALDGCWGVYAQTLGPKPRATLKVLHGRMALRRLVLPDLAGGAASVDGERLTVSHENGTIILGKPVTLKPGHELTVTS